MGAIGDKSDRGRGSSSRGATYRKLARPRLTAGILVLAVSAIASVAVVTRAQTVSQSRVPARSWLDEEPTEVPSQVGAPESAAPNADSELADVPPMNGDSIEGLVVEEADLELDVRGNVVPDRGSSAVDLEPIPEEMAKRLDALSAEREEMAEHVALEPPLVLETQSEVDASAGTDGQRENPDRVNLIDSRLVESE